MSVASTASSTISRRGLLRGLTVGSVGLVGFSGTASARPERAVVGTNTSTATRAAAQAAGASGRVVGLGRFGWAVAGRFPPQALDGLARRPDVRYVEPDELLHAIGHEGTELEWGVDRIDADLAHVGGQTGAGAHVAILDTGIDADHPDLEPNIDSTLSRSFVERSWSSPGWDDDNGHGTHCAGIAAAVTDDSGVVGVAPGATLHAVKVLDANGSGYSSEIAAGLTWVADTLPVAEGVVASMSFGGSSTLSVVKEACAYAYEKGVLLVAAAGNTGPCDNCVSFPARTNTVVAVGATERNDSLASFSSTGKAVELVAPGVDVHSTTPGGDYASWSGTSMACPHVAGVAALLMANGRYPHATNVVFDGDRNRLIDDAYLNPGGARGRLRETGELLSGIVSNFGDRSNEQGFGLVDAERAALDGSGGGGDDGGSGDDGTGGGSGGDPLAIDSFTVESQAPRNPHAELDVAWQVSGSPDTVTLALTGPGADETWNVGASGTRSYVRKHTSGTYTVTLTATRGAESVTASRTVSA